VRKINPRKIGLALLPLLATLFISSALAETTDISVSASVSKYISVTFSYTSLNFGTVNSPSTDNKPTNFNQDDGELNVTVDTNYDYTVAIRGTDFSGPQTIFGPQTIAIFNMKAKVSNTLTDIVNKVNPTTLSTSDQTIFTKTVIQAGIQDPEYHGYWLDIPSTIYSGLYNSTITLTHSNA
jgi:hypothetical protein